VTSLVGIIGAVVGGFIAGPLHIGGRFIVTIIIAVVGAVILTFLLRLIGRKRS
jgi:uncharacterized membrane protein YeaQ/YmgE (transglycosylase-associated protein family)